MINKKMIIFSVLFIFLSLPVIGLAEEETESKKEEKEYLLAEIVVSSNSPDIKLLETPGTINIFTAKDLEKGAYMDVADVIKNLPGITNDTTNAAMPKYNFRGTAYAHSRGATVYVDGQEVTSGRIGYGDLSYVDLNDIEQIQVMKTPGAQFSEPSRGIIYITTKKGKKDGHRQRLKVQYGSWGLHKENLSFWGKESGIDYRLSVMNQGGEGYRYTDDERTRVNVKAGYSFDDSTRLGIKASYQDQSYFSGTSLYKWQWDRDPRDNTPPNSETDPTYDLLPYDYDVEIYDMAMDFRTDKETWFAKSMLSYNNNNTNYLSQKNRNRYEEGEDASSYLRDYEEERLSFNASGGYKYNRGNLWSTLSIGTEFDRHDYSQGRDYPFLSDQSSRTTLIQQYTLDISVDRLSFFINNDLKAGEYFRFQTGVRYDNVDLKCENLFDVYPDVNNEYDEVSWNISPSYSFTGDDNLYMTVSQSYFYPNIDYTRMSAEKEDDFPENDPENLKPEDIFTWELGFKNKFNRFLNYSISIYHMTINDKFIFQYRQDEEDNWDSLGAVNLGKTVHKGLELELDGWITEKLNYRLNYGYLKAEWDDPDAIYRSYIWADDPSDDEYGEVYIDGKTLYRTPKHKIGGSFSYYPVKNLTTWLNIMYVDDQYVDYLERVIQPSVTTMDFKVNYKFTNLFNGVSIYGLVKNLTDENYAYYSNSSGARNDDGTLNTTYYPYPGRYFEVGMIFNF
ncbi:MAG: TonB-dependent receptor [Desulfobacteraceae bacterium]|jgi:outer membrane receptor protein involved in Fe transport